ncbi:MAG: pitrilysin family protein [Candidatus Electryonea clarkiae]|nr:pitrilysin family protein [Candidatus Electryonea clarkiae]
MAEKPKKGRISMIKRLAIGLAVGMVFCFTAFAAEETPAPILNPDILNVQEYSLENGLQVLMLEDHSAPVITYMVYYRVGSRNEEVSKTGIAHFFEHMMFNGSKKYAREEHAHIVQANGGSLNANTWYDRTAYYENIAADKLELVVHLEAERQANLAIVDSVANKERGAVTEERRMRVDNSIMGEAFEEVFTNAFRAHPYSWPVIGWMSDIEGWEIEDLRKFHKTWYAPNNATVILAGDFDPEEAKLLIDKYYSKIPSQPVPPDVRTVEPPQKGERRIKLHRIAQLPFLLTAYHVPEASHDDMAALEVLQKILSDGKSSRIYKRCIYDDQVAAFAGGFLFDLKDPGIFLAYIGVNPGVEMEVAEKALFEEIEGIPDNPPTERELQKAKNQLEADYIFGLQTVNGKASAIGESVILYDGDYNAFLEKPAKYRAVTIEDVQRVAKAYFHDRNRTVLIVVPEIPDMGMMQMGGGE